ncbi:MAG: hypothetical protein KJ749_14880 [Planctomycetes bacterium]|nr:hypothetical protein [Planctomycetota bacterium]
MLRTTPKLTAPNAAPSPAEPLGADSCGVAASCNNEFCSYVLTAALDLCYYSVRVFVPIGRGLSFNAGL